MKDRMKWVSGRVYRVSESDDDKVMKKREYEVMVIIEWVVKLRWNVMGWV